MLSCKINVFDIFNMGAFFRFHLYRDVLEFCSNQTFGWGCTGKVYDFFTCDSLSCTSVTLEGYWIRIAWTPPSRMNHPLVRVPNIVNRHFPSLNFEIRWCYSSPSSRPETRYNTRGLYANCNRVRSSTGILNILLKKGAFKYIWPFVPSAQFHRFPRICFVSVYRFRGVWPTEESLALVSNIVYCSDIYDVYL